MKTKNIKYFLITVLLLSGCSQFSTISERNPATDFSELKTYTWGDNAIQFNRTEGAVDRVMEKISVMVRDNLQSIVDEHLTQKGYTRIKNGDPDFVVQYAATGDVQNTQQPDAHTTGISGAKDQVSRSNVVVIGTLTISVLQPVTQKTVWQGQVETLVKGDGDTTTRLKKAVAKLMRDFPEK